MWSVTCSIVDCTSKLDRPSRSQIVYHSRNFHQLFLSEDQHAPLSTGKLVLEFKLEHLKLNSVALAAIVTNS